MEREEAIDIVKCLAWHRRPDEEDIEQAIKALEQDELLDYVTKSIEAEKKMMGSCHDFASEDYHKGIIYAFECMKMKLM